MAKRTNPKSQKAKGTINRLESSALPDGVQTIETIEKVLGPEYRKPFTLFMAIIATTSIILYGAHVLGEMMDTRARAAWSQEYTEAKAKHEAIDTTLKIHEERIGTLERQGQEVRGMLIEIKAGVQAQTNDMQSIKSDVRDIQQRTALPASRR